MVTLRNPNEVVARTVVASEQLFVGAVCRLIQGTAKGEPCQVRLATAADIAAAAYSWAADVLTAPVAKLGIVTWVPDDDMAVDYVINPITKEITVNTGTDQTVVIPSGSLVTFVYRNPVIGVRKTDVDSTMATNWDSIREGDLLTVEADTGLIKERGAGEFVLGHVHQHDGFELTLDLTAL